MNEQIFIMTPNEKQVINMKDVEGLVPEFELIYVSYGDNQLENNYNATM